MMDKKFIFIVLIVMVITHQIYDGALLFVSKDFHALFANAWFLTLFGYIAIRLIDDSMENGLLIKKKFESIVSLYPIYRCSLHTHSFLQSFEIEGSWGRYKTVTSSTYADVIVWLIILIILIVTFRKEIYRKIKGYVQR